MTRRRRKPPTKFRDYATGKSLLEVDRTLKIAERSKSQKNKDLRAEKERKNRILKRKLQKLQGPAKAVVMTELPTSETMTIVPSISTAPGVKTAQMMVSSNPNLSKRDQPILAPQKSPVLIDPANLTVDEWQNQMAKQLNEIGIGESELSTSGKTISLLSPALITERGGLCYVTNLLGVRKKGEGIVTPREFQLPTMTPAQAVAAKRVAFPPIPPSTLTIPRTRQQALPVFDGERIQELSDNNDYEDSDGGERGHTLEQNDLESNPSSSQRDNDDGANLQNELPLLRATRAPTSLPPLPKSNQRSSPSSSENDPSQNQSREKNQNYHQETAPPPTTTTTTTTTTLPTTKSTVQTSGRQSDQTTADRPNGFDLFYNPKRSSTYSALDIKKFKQKNDSISRHKPFLASFKRNPIISTGLYTHLFADTIAAYKNHFAINRDYGYILVVVCGLSKQLFTAPLYFNTQEEVTPALEKIFSRLDLPGHTFFLTDRGKEFEINSWGMLERWGMTPVYLRGRHKSAPVERVM